jgi:hypothetical protein
MNPEAYRLDDKMTIDHRGRERWLEHAFFFFFSKEKTCLDLEIYTRYILRSWYTILYYI